jgi:2-haloacid dehalogenase
MQINRREFVALTAASVASAIFASSPQIISADAIAETPPTISAIAFDAFVIFDPRPVFALADHFFPGKGAELSAEWRIRQFEYTWLRVITGDYADFWQVTNDALTYAVKKLKLDLTTDTRDRLMKSYLNLKPWPDVPAALAKLKQSGLRLAFLSNFTPTMLRANIESANLGNLFDHVLSTHQAKTYKPDPRGYQLGPDALKLPRQSILFAAFAGWDAVGAAAFGFPTYWVNRTGLPAEELGERAIPSAADLTGVVQFLKI